MDCWNLGVLEERDREKRGGSSMKKTMEGVASYLTLYSFARGKKETMP